MFDFENIDWFRAAQSCFATLLLWIMTHLYIENDKKESLKSEDDKI
ncbi:MAG: hypothetical protein HRT47_12040 [Candidatus Caenarcaniphilales bacterium]|nr:hypothetical protein [Candidatus Caenarcaniphilales bacterium]